MMRIACRWLGVISSVVVIVGTAQGQHQDVLVSLDGENRLVATPSVSTDLFEDFFGTWFQDDPGVNATSGTLAPGDQIGWNAVDHLLFTDGGAVSAPPGGEEIEIAKLGQFAFVGGDEEFTAGYLFAEAGALGGIHEHFGYTLLPGETDPTPGAYGLLLELTSPRYESSEPLLIVLGHLGGDFTELDQLVAARDALTAYAFPIEGDVDRDGDVDLTDFNLLKANFGLAGVDREQGDLTGDGAVDLIDFNVLKTNFGAVHPALATIPEPATVLLAALAAAVAFAKRKLK